MGEKKSRIWGPGGGSPVGRAQAPQIHRERRWRPQRFSASEKGSRPWCGCFEERIVELVSRRSWGSTGGSRLWRWRMRRLWHGGCLQVRSESKGRGTLETPGGDRGLKTKVGELDTWPTSLLDRKDRPVLEVGLPLRTKEIETMSQVVSISHPGEGAP